MRIIKSQKYYKLSENLNEAHEIADDIPVIEKFLIKNNSDEDASSLLYNFLKS